MLIPHSRFRSWSSEISESKLRKELDTELGGKYTGVKSSRAELFGGSGNSSGRRGGSDGEDDEDEELDSQEDDDEDEDDDEEIFSGEDDDMDEDDDEELDDDDDEEEEEAESLPIPSLKKAPASTISKKKSGTSKSIEDDSRAMIQELKKASNAEVEKGRDVRKQLVSDLCVTII